MGFKEIICIVQFNKLKNSTSLTVSVAYKVVAINSYELRNKDDDQCQSAPPQLADLGTTDPISLTDMLAMPTATTTQEPTDTILLPLVNEVLIHLNSQDILVFRSVATSFKLIPLPNHLKDRIATKNNDNLTSVVRGHLDHLDHIYSGENKKKIVLELLKNIQDNPMFKDIAKNCLVSYLNGCESLNLHLCPINNEQLKILSALLPPSVQDLNLRYTNITDVSMLAKLTSLQKLDLGGITNIDFELFATLKKLKELIVSDGKIDDFSGLAKLTSLQKLDLVNITDIDFELFATLTSLKILHLERTNIPKDGLSKLPLSLEKLSFERTDITDFSAFAKLKKLKELELSVSESTIDDFSGLAKLTSLKTLDLSCTNLEDDDLGKFPQGLWKITIGANEITDISKLANQTSLEILSLNYTDITEEDLTKLPPKLRCLYLEGTNITDISKLANQTSLETINLNDSRITKEGLSELPPKLKILHLGCTDITDQEIHQLKQLNKSLKVKH